MKKKLKKLMALMLAGVMMLALVACGGGSSNSGGGNTAGGSGNSGAGASGAEFAKTKIGVAFYQDSGKAVTATKAFLEEVGAAMNVEFTYATFSQMDEATNVATVQQMISSGVKGIIGTMDLGTEAIIAECEAAGVYYAGYLCDFDTSYTMSKDAVFGSEMFLGAVADGPCTDNVQVGQWSFDSLIEYNEANPDAPIQHVSLAIFPDWAYPAQTTAANQFIEEVEAYNGTSDVQITADPLDQEVDVLQFSPLDSTYFSKHPGIDAIIGIAAGTSFIYPTMVSSGVDSDIKLFTSGYEGGEEENFGTAGTMTYQQIIVSPVEAVAYPLVLMVNAINGAEFSDAPATAERIDSSDLIVNSDADMEKFLGNIYCTGNVADSFWTAEDVVNMTAVANPDATYAGLVEAVQGLTIEAIK